MDTPPVTAPRLAPIRRQLAAQLAHVIEHGGLGQDQALPRSRELAGFLGIDSRMVASVIRDLERDGYVEARRGEGVFVAQTPPAHPFPDAAEDAAGAAAIPTPGGRRTADVLLVECSEVEFAFFARELVAHLAVHVDKVLLDELATVAARPRRAERWGAAVTSFGHLSEVARLLKSTGIPVIALLAEAHVETLHWLAQLPSGTRVGVASAAAATAHNLAHSVANAGLPNIVLVGACPAGGAALGRLVRQVDVLVCSTAAAERVRRLAGSTVSVLIDDRAVDQRGIDMLTSALVGTRVRRARVG